MAKRCMQWADIDGKRRLLVGKVNKFIPNPTFDPIAAPGSLEDYFRGRNTEGLDLKTMFGELDPITEHPEYRDRAARVRQLDEQGLAGALLFPTLGVGMQEALNDACRRCTPPSPPSTRGSTRTGASTGATAASTPHP
ncbi:MAG: hypothetical protein R2699_19475 [Acidimicrobiales bacterium]